MRALGEGGRTESTCREEVREISCVGSEKVKKKRVKTQRAGKNGGIIIWCTQNNTPQIQKNCCDIRVLWGDTGAFTIPMLCNVLTMLCKLDSSKWKQLFIHHHLRFTEIEDKSSKRERVHYSIFENISALPGKHNLYLLTLWLLLKCKLAFLCKCVWTSARKSSHLMRSYCLPDIVRIDKHCTRHKL